MDNKEIKKLSYKELRQIFCDFNNTHNWANESIEGVIVFTEDSFDKQYSLESRSYEVSSNNKAFRNANGYSIFGSALDGSDYGVRLEAYMAEEQSGRNGWKVDYCYLIKKGDK